MTDFSGLRLEPYRIQSGRWPADGRVILAQFDEDSIVVYQAYRPETAEFAVQHGYFERGFSLTRMTWIKPNFLWMMYRSGWATKQGQQSVLAVRIRRRLFDAILAQAVHSSFVVEVYGSHEAWKTAVAESDVRLQWDPDHDAAGNKLERRAIQLGLRRDAIRKYAREWILEVVDVTPLVAEQRSNAADNWDDLLLPREEVYPVQDEDTASRLGVITVA